MKKGDKLTVTATIESLMLGTRRARVQIGNTLVWVPLSDTNYDELVAKEESDEYIKEERRRRLIF